MVRPLAQSDFEGALRLYQTLTRDPVSVSTSIEAFLAVLNHAGTSIMGAKVNGLLVGMATLHLLPNMTSGGRPYGLIENVVTDTDYRGKGIGRTVLQACVEHAKFEGAYKLMLLTGEGRGAVGFYEKLGFTGYEKHGLIYRF